MTVDPAVVPGLLLLAAELVALAVVGYVVARTVLRQDDERVALAQGLVIGLALWGLMVNVVRYAIPGLGGVIVAWILILALGAGLAWRAGRPIRPGMRAACGLVVAALALFWIALAVRQLLTLPEAFLHLGLAASIQAGGFHPPVFPWNPDLPTAYHYGVKLLVGLLAPPIGLDLAFVTELLNAYIWMSFALLVGSLLIRRGSWIAALVVGPLLLTAGAWTTVHYSAPPSILQIPGPVGLPVTDADVPTWLTEAYWPSTQYPWTRVFEVPLPNIWNSAYVLAYALALVVLERAAGDGRRSWPTALALAAIVGFLSLADEAVALIVLGLWVVLEAARLLTARPPRGQRTREAVRAVAGPALAALAVAAGGGTVTGLLSETSGTGLSLGWMADPGSRRPIGEFIHTSGDLGLLGLGVIPVAAIAALLAWRDRLVVALAVGAGVFLLAALTLRYEFSQDVVRLDGHARNFALLGFVVAVGARLHTLRPRWRYAAAALLVALIVWPTAVTRVRNLGVGIDSGVALANAEPRPPGVDSDFLGRHGLETSVPAGITAYIRDHTAADARILTPEPSAMSIATGRANVSGFTQFIQFSNVRGTKYLDAIRQLEPAAVRQLGVDYVHANDDWLADLPPRAVGWLENQEFFELLVRDGSDALYRIQPAFMRLQVAPAPQSFEALRRAVPASAKVFLSPSIDYLGSARAASVLSHARLLGVVRVFGEHLRPSFDTQPLGEHTPDLVVTSARLAPSAFPPSARTPIWWNDEIAVYAPHRAVAPIMRPPAPLVSVRLSDVRVDDARVAFSVTLAARAAASWTGQDWVLAAADASPWSLPHEFEGNGRVHVTAQWFEGQFLPGHEIQRHAYILDASAASLSVQSDGGRSLPATSSGSSLGPGTWVLALRLRHDWWESAFIPVIRIEVTEDGALTYEAYEGALSVTPIP